MGAVTASDIARTGKEILTAQLGLLSKSFEDVRSPIVQIIVQKVVRFASQTNVPCSACVSNRNVGYHERILQLQISWKPNKLPFKWKRSLSLAWHQVLRFLWRVQL